MPDKSLCNGDRIKVLYIKYQNLDICLMVVSVCCSYGAWVNQSKFKYLDFSFLHFLSKNLNSAVKNDLVEQ